MCEFEMDSARGEGRIGAQEIPLAPNESCQFHCENIPTTRQPPKYSNVYISPEPIADLQSPKTFKNRFVVMEPISFHLRLEVIRLDDEDS